MPFTPYHLGPALLAGVALFPFIDFVAVLVASVVLDIEPMFVLFLNLGGPLHGLSHTYLIATLVSCAMTGVLWFLRDEITAIASIFGVVQEPTKLGILAASLFGTYSHVFLDSFLYAEMNPFFPVLGNPFLGLVASAAIYQFCLYCGAIGALLYIVRFCVLKRGPRVQSIDPFS
jgi:hypothetical protein